MFLLLVALLLGLYIINRLSCGRIKSPTCLVGKTAIVTGGNSGIGYEVCLDLASRGCKVIIADKDDSEKSRLAIIKQTNNPNIVSKFVDLASFKSIRTFAADIQSNETQLDILVNNAGVGYESNRQPEDGVDATMQINYFGPFLLTHLLINLLKKSSPSRIIFTSSLMAFLGSATKTDRISNPKERIIFAKSWYVYSDSKLTTIMASDIFAEKLKAYGVTCNSLHPGFVRTPIFRKTAAHFVLGPLFLWFMQFLGYIVGKDPWEGAQTTIHLAVSKNVQNTTGQYFADCRPICKPPQAYNKELAKKVWQISEQSVGLRPEERI